MRKGKAALSADDAQAIALKALGFLAEDGARLGRFLALSGMGPAELRAAAGEPETLAAVIDYLLSDETLLLQFTANNGLDPAVIQPAHHLLTGGFEGGAR